MTAAPDPGLTSEREAAPVAPPPATATPATTAPLAPPDDPDRAPALSHREPPRPRRLLQLALVGLGIFLLVVGILLPLYVYPRLAVLPLDPQTAQTLTASGATVLMPDADSPAGATVLTGVNLTITNFAAAPAGVEPDDGDAVWDIATQVNVDGRGMLQSRVERISIDRRTTESTNCCGDRIVTSQEEPDGKELRHEGYYTFPFDTQKQNYQVWDINLERSSTAEYVGEETKDGIDTYVFRKVVPLQKIGSMELPGGLFGSKEPNVDAEAWYADTRTYWIEPNTGDVIGIREEVTQQYTANGQTVTAFEATMDSEKLDADRLDQDKTASVMLPWLRGRASVVLVLLGLLLFVAAALIARPIRVRRRTSAH